MLQEEESKQLENNSQEFAKSFLQRFIKLEKLSEGSYGCVYKAQDKQFNRPVALKKMSLDIYGQGVPSYILRETSSLRDLQSKYIAELLDIVVEQPYIYLVFEYMQSDLRQYILKAQQNGGLSESQVKEIMYQILLGIQYCHSRNIMHRDLKPSNILIQYSQDSQEKLMTQDAKQDSQSESQITEENSQNSSSSEKGFTVKITDFGLSRVFSLNSNNYTDGLVTIWYRAPEILVSNQYTQAIDMWSAGCIMGELYTQQPMFPGQSELNQLESIFQILGSPNEEEWKALQPSKQMQNVQAYPKGKLFTHIPRLATMSQEGKDLLCNLLTYDPNKRFTAKQALQSLFFQKK